MVLNPLEMSERVLQSAQKRAKTAFQRVSHLSSCSMGCILGIWSGDITHTNCVLSAHLYHGAGSWPKFCNWAISKIPDVVTTAPTCLNKPDKSNFQLNSRIFL